MGRTVLIVVLIYAVFVITATSHAKESVKKTTGCTTTGVKQKSKTIRLGKIPPRPVDTDKKTILLKDLQKQDTSLLTELERN